MQNLVHKPAMFGKKGQTIGAYSSGNDQRRKNIQSDG